MPLEERRVEINGLTPGMYVCRLDRPWTETPYPLQGFLVESPADIEQLRRYSSYVYIDVEKSLDRSERGVLLRNQAVGELDAAERRALELMRAHKGKLDQILIRCGGAQSAPLELFGARMRCT